MVLVTCKTLYKMTIEQRIENIERMLRQIVRDGAGSGPHWVKVSAIAEATGWDNKTLRRMRETGVVRFRRKNGFEYDLNSIPAQFIKR